MRFTFTSQYDIILSKGEVDCEPFRNNIVERCDNGVYLITMPNHITTVIDGVVYDTFDCRDRLIWNIWEVK